MWVKSSMLAGGCGVEGWGTFFSALQQHPARRPQSRLSRGTQLSVEPEPRLYLPHPHGVEFRVLWGLNSSRGSSVGTHGSLSTHVSQLWQEAGLSPPLNFPMPGVQQFIRQSSQDILGNFPSSWCYYMMKLTFCVLHSSNSFLLLCQLIVYFSNLYLYINICVTFQRQTRQLLEASRRL